MEKEFQHSLNKFQNTSKEEISQIKSIISNNLGLERKTKRGRPPKSADEKYKSIAIRLNPRIVKWFKEQALIEKTGYQTLINKVLLNHVENNPTQQ